MKTEIKKLLLTSAAFVNPKIGQKFLELVGKNPQDIRVLFIPTASEYKLDNGEGMFYVKESEKELINMGMLKENIFWFDIKNISTVGELSNYDVIYVCGGNTFYLMYYLKNTGFDKKIIELVNAGKVYVGVSAGSVIAGPDISIAGPFDENEVGLKDTKGLGFINKAICPHYQRKDKSIIDKLKVEFPYEILPLTDNQALEVLDGVSKIIE